MTLSEAAIGAISSLAARRRLLIISDFDGTLSPIVDDPRAAIPLPGISDSFRRLAEIPGTTCVILSGRERSDLLLRLGCIPGVRMLGTYGLESGEALPPTDQERSTLDRTLWRARTTMASIPGIVIESKRFSVAIHYRRVTRERWAEARLAAHAALKGLHLIQGNAVTEGTVRSVRKSDSVQQLRDVLGSDVPLVYLGDDDSDEEVLAGMRPPDLGFCVGRVAHHHAHSIASPEVAAEVIALLTELRCRN